MRLAEFKSGTLASLRSLLPKDWTTQHEVAWSWLWDLVERQVQTNMGMPAKWERAYASFLDGIDEATGFNLRRDIYLTLPGACWTGLLQTIKHKLAPRFHESFDNGIGLVSGPCEVVDSISGVGLHHVGYGTPNIPHVSVPLQTANLSLHRCSRGGWTGIRTQVVGQRHPSVGLRRVGCASPAELLPVLLCNRRGDSQLLVR